MTLGENVGLRYPLLERAMRANSTREVLLLGQHSDDINDRTLGDLIGIRAVGCAGKRRGCCRSHGD